MNDGNDAPPLTDFLIAVRDFTQIRIGENPRPSSISDLRCSVIDASFLDETWPDGSHTRCYGPDLGKDVNGDIRNRMLRRVANSSNPNKIRMLS